jgi:hypothetical protein
MKARTVIEVIASLLIVLFLYAATTQVVSHPTFQSQINRSLSNAALSGIIAWLIPAIQLTMVFLLWRPATRLAAFSCSLAIVSCYTVYLVMMLPGAYNSFCNCGELWRQARLEINILVNVAIIFLAATAIILTGRFKENSPRFS